MCLDYLLVLCSLVMNFNYICPNNRISIGDSVYYNRNCGNDSRARARTDMHVRQAENSFPKTTEITDGGS